MEAEGKKEVQPNKSGGGLSGQKEKQIKTTRTWTQQTNAHSPAGSLLRWSFVNIDDFGFAVIIHGFVAGDALQLTRYLCHAVDLLADSG